MTTIAASMAAPNVAVFFPRTDVSLKKTVSITIELRVCWHTLHSDTRVVCFQWFMPLHVKPSTGKACWKAIRSSSNKQTSAAMRKWKKSHLLRIELTDVQSQRDCYKYWTANSHCACLWKVIQLTFTVGWCLFCTVSLACDRASS